MWFAFFSAFSCQTVFDQTSVILFNLLFTVLPPIMIGIFEKATDQKFVDPMEYNALQKKAFTITVRVFVFCYLFICLFLPKTIII